VRPFDRVKRFELPKISRLRPRNVIQRFGPHVVDARLITLLSIAVAVGWFLIEWNAKSLRLVVDGHRLGWLATVSFGLVWMAGRDVKWRTAAGMTFGTLASLAAVYGAMGTIPLLPLAFAVWLGVSIGVAAAISGILPRLFSFGAMVVGFGLGVGIAVTTEILPTTSATDWFNVVMTTMLGLAIGIILAEGLHAVVDALTRLPVESTIPKSSRERRPAMRLLHRREKVS
jgi:hypothetical protein